MAIAEAKKLNARKLAEKDGKLVEEKPDVILCILIFLKVNVCIQCSKRNSTLYLKYYELVVECNMVSQKYNPAQEQILFKLIEKQLRISKEEQ